MEEAIIKSALVGQQTGSKMQSDLNIADWDAAALSQCRGPSSLSSLLCFIQIPSPKEECQIAKMCHGPVPGCTTGRKTEDLTFAF